MDRNYTDEDLVRAERAVWDAGISIRKAQRNYEVSFSAEYSLALSTLELTTPSYQCI